MGVPSAWRGSARRECLRCGRGVGDVSLGRQLPIAPFIFCLKCGLATGRLRTLLAPWSTSNNAKIGWEKLAEECEQANSILGERVSEACSTVQAYMDRITQVIEQADLTIHEQANKLYDVLCDLEEMKCLKQAFCDFGNHIGDISSIH